MERVFSKSTLREFWEKHPDSEQYLKTWYETVMNSKWRNPSDVKKTFVHASLLKNNRVVFNIKLVFNTSIFYITDKQYYRLDNCFVGTT
jgi:mRNA interferase HigB